MRKPIKIAAVLGAFLAGAGLALAGVSGDTITAAFTPSTYYKAPTGIRNYLKVAGTAAGTATFNQFQQEMDLLNSSAASTYTINLYAPAADGTINCMESVGGVTTLTLAATAPPTGSTATIDNGITAMTALTRYCYLYSSANNTWDRIQ